MTLSLYYTAGSAPCRVVLLVASALNLHLDLKTVNLMAGEHMKPEFLQLNPQHTVPTLVDDGFALWESRAIGRYLVNKYGSDSTLYPTDPKIRAVIDQRLDFDLGTLYLRFSEYYYPQLFGGAPVDQDLYKKLDDALTLFNTLLDSSKFAAGDELSLADLSLVATVSTIDAAGISLKPYSNVQRWFELVQNTAPGYEDANGKGIKAFKEMIAHIKGKTEL